VYSRRLIQREGADGIARCGGRSPSVARKLPKQRPRSPRVVTETEKPLLGATPWERRYTTSPAGSSGGSAEGASEGRQPLTGPHLPPPEAAQTKQSKAAMPAGHTKATFQRTSPAFLLPVAPAPQTSSLRHPPRRRPKLNKRKAPMPAGHKSLISKDRIGFILLKRPPRIPSPRRRLPPPHTGRPAFSNAGLLNSDRQTS